MAKIVRRVSRFVVRFVLVLLALATIAATIVVVVDWRARQNDEVLIVEVPFMQPGDAMTTGRIIFIQTDRADDAGLLAHELVHVCQWEQQGITFLLDYTTEYTENLVETGDLETAYIELSFEEEARLREVDCDLDRYVVRQP